MISNTIKYVFFFFHWNSQSLFLIFLKNCVLFFEQMNIFNKYKNYFKDINED